MFLHLGHGVMVSESRVVAIVDSTLLDHSPETRQYFNRMRGQSQVYGDLSETKSLVICADAVYCSQISAATLVRRMYGRPYGALI